MAGDIRRQLANRNC